MTVQSTSSTQCRPAPAAGVWALRRSAAAVRSTGYRSSSSAQTSPAARSYDHTSAHLTHRTLRTAISFHSFCPLVHTAILTDSSPFRHASPNQGTYKKRAPVQKELHLWPQKSRSSSRSALFDHLWVRPESTGPPLSSSIMRAEKKCGLGLSK